MSKLPGGSTVEKATDEASPVAAANPAARVLDESLRRQIEAFFPRYPTRRAVVLPALHLIHEALGHVPIAAVAELAGMLGLTPAQVQDTLTFYGFFRQDRPVGQLRIMVCRSLSCSALGGEHLLDRLCRRLGIPPGETTADGRFTVEFAECLGLCDVAPALLAGNQVHGHLDEEKLDRLIDEWMQTVKSPPAVEQQSDAAGRSPVAGAAPPATGGAPQTTRR